LKIHEVQVPVYLLLLSSVQLQKSLKKSSQKSKKTNTGWAFMLTTHVPNSTYQNIFEK